MKIKMYVKEGGFVAFECLGVLKELPEKVILDNQTRMISLVFKDSEEVELDCQVDTEAIAAIGAHEYCIMGFRDEHRILGATMVKFEGRAG